MIQQISDNFWQAEARTKETMQFIGYQTPHTPQVPENVDSQCQRRSRKDG
ncbi:MAG: hypothetical protein PHY28_00110 [Dehalococcoidales bacterium]|nr:hypothetical protein [Dehalococcoidales bacterium]